MPVAWIAHQSLLDEIDFPAIEQRGKLLPHVDKPLEGHRPVGSKTDQYVAVAIGSEIISQGRTKKRRLGNLPLFIEGLNSLVANFEWAEPPTAQ